MARRKRRLGSSCANPLFVKWVEELRDDAKERGLKSHYNYTKVSLVFVVDETLYLFYTGPQLHKEVSPSPEVRGRGKNTGLCG